MGRARQLANSLDGVNLRGELRKNRRLITRPGADFQYATFLIQLQQLGHPRHDEWLRDRLIKINWQSVIAIGPAT